jgi:hypothetical protein
MLRALFAAVSLIALAASVQGKQEPASVRGTVFDDANRNGQRDQGERALGGIVVSNQRDVTRTDADGGYSLPGPGYGVVFVSLPDGHAAVQGFWRAASSGARVDFALTARSSPTSFTFIHASDPHVSAQSLARLQRLHGIGEKVQPAFVLMTGDLVRDALRVGEDEARGYYDLYTAEIKKFSVAVWSVPGNHENFGIERHLSLVSAKHPLYGKGMYRARLGPNYYSFNYGGIHFVGLDTVDIADLWYFGHVDDAQLGWLKADLAHTPAEMPVVTFNHIPFVTSVDAVGGYEEDGPAPTLIKVAGKTAFRHVVSNLNDVLAAIGSRDWPLALGGHMHTRESVTFASAVRTRFHQAAAIVGPTQNVVPAMSGVTVYRVKNRVIDDGEFVPLPK